VRVNLGLSIALRSTKNALPEHGEQDTQIFP
jgi:hypothetical protein